jgi:hypothetical protein
MLLDTDTEEDNEDGPYPNDDIEQFQAGLALEELEDYDAE